MDDPTAPGRAGTVPGPAAGPAAAPGRWGQWSVWRFVRFVVGKVILEPIAFGRLKDNGWPAGLKAIVGVWAVLYAAMIAAAVFAAELRSHDHLLYASNATFPQMALPPVLLALAFALTCLYTAGLHLTWWLRLSITFAVGALLLHPVSWRAMAASDIAIVVAVGALVLMLGLRWGRRFHWLEFVAALAVIGHAMLAGVVFGQQVSAGWAIDLHLYALTKLLYAMWCLAVPVALVAGAALAELTASTVAWSVTGASELLAARRRWTPVLGAAVLAVLICLRGVQAGWHVVRGADFYRLDQIATSVGVLALVLAVCAAMTWRADRTVRGDPALRADPDDVTTGWRSWSLVLAGVLAAPVGGPILVSEVLSGVGLDDLGDSIVSLGGPWQFPVLSAAAAVAVLGMAFVLSGRGRRVAPILLAAAGSSWLVTTGASQLNLHATEPGMMIAAFLAAVVVFVWLVLRRRLTVVRGVALATVVVLSGVFKYRDVLEDPLTAVFSVAGVSATLLVGLLWRMLTDASYSRGDSRRIPRSSRVLLAMAGNIYAATLIGVVALMGGHWSIQIGWVETAGDSSLGISLASAVVFAGLSLAARGRVVRSDEPRDDRGQFRRPP